MTVQLLFGFDTERPYGPQAKTDEGKAEREANLELIARMNSRMDKNGAGRTFFILGEYLEASAEQVGNEYLRQVFNPQNELIEIGQHTYSHVTVAPIATRPDKKPVSSEVLRDELKKADTILKSTLGVNHINGLRTPLGYSHMALAGNEEVLQALKDAKLLYVSSSLRSRDWGINAPLQENGEERQPFIYFNDVVEVPSHGWQDTAFTGTSKTQGTENYPTTQRDIVAHYASLINEAEKLASDGRKIHLGLCMHPWAVRKYDSNLEVITGLLDVAQEKGMEATSYGKAAYEVLENNNERLQREYS